MEKSDLQEENINLTTFSKAISERYLSYALSTITSRSLPEIGRKFGGRDHTTVIHSVKTVEKLKKENNEILNGIDYLKNRILYKKENEI